MKKIIFVLLSMLIASTAVAASNPASASASASAAASAPTANVVPDTTNEQRTRIAICNRTAGNRNGEERKAFMKDCVSKKPGTAKAK